MFITFKIIFSNYYFQSAVGWDHQEHLSKHESQTDASKGFGGKYGVQKVQDKVLCLKYQVFNINFFQSAVGWDHQEHLSKHESQTDASKGFGGKYGVQKVQDKVLCLKYQVFNINFFQSAVGWDHQEHLSMHGSQTDASKGFGGKYGVQKDRQDKAAGGYDDMEEVKSSYKTDRGGARGQAGDIRARFEKMASQEQEEAGRRAEEEKQRRLAREKKEREEQERKQRQQEVVMIYIQPRLKWDYCLHLKNIVFAHH